MMRHRGMLAAGAAGTVLVLSGCQFQGAASLPLPGGQGTGSDAYSVRVQFEDVLDLVKQSAVKVDDVTVGSVSDIQLNGYTAVVTVSIKPDVKLPENVHASLRQTSLLGEKFVSLDRPADEAPVGRLHDGDTIPLARTTRNAEIEEVLSTLSLVLNGGSLEQLQTINRELTLALKGREGKVKDFLTQLDSFVSGLDKQKQDIVNVLDSLDRLTSRLAAQRDTLAVALRDIPGGVKVLADERAQLTQVLTGLDKLGNVATDVIQASQQNTVTDLKALQPILGQLNAAGSNLPKSLELLTTFPFPRTIDQGIFGDDANLFATVDLDLRDVLGNQAGSAGSGGTATSKKKGGTAAPSVPSVPSLPSVPSVPTLPTLPGLTSPQQSPQQTPAPGLGGLLGGSLSAGADPNLLGLLLGGLS